MALGLILALVAMLAWAVGDWHIQKGTRIFGDWATLFLIGAVGSVVLLPFVYRDLSALTPAEWRFFLVLGALTLFGALFLFEGLKRGKIAVIEPIFGVELPFTVAFSVLFGGERLLVGLYALVGLVFFGLLLVAAKEIHHLHFHRTIFERGVVWAGIGAVTMGLMNFLTGLGSQAVSPLVTIWFVHSFLAVSCLLYLLLRGEVSHLRREIRKRPLFTLGTGVFDNIAWVAYATSMTLIPISIATAVSESYIALTVLFGLFINRERVKPHQLLGVVIVVVGILALAFFSDFA